MSLARTLVQFQSEVAQCESLIANAHRLDPAGAPILPGIDREQITTAAFLNMFKAWEGFLESALTKYMIGRRTTDGHRPKKYVRPRDAIAAQQMVIGTQRYFDFANHDNVKKIANLYFVSGYPFEPHLSAIFSELADLKTMRNAAAHVSSTAQAALDALALRLFGASSSGISLYRLLTTADPTSNAGDTVFVAYRRKLETAADLISRG